MMADNQVGGEQSGKNLDELTTYLRDNPHSASDPPAEIAEKFGLPVEFIENVQLGLRGPVQRDSALKRIGRISRSVIQWILVVLNIVKEGVVGFARRLTKHPMIFVLVSGGLLALGSLVYRRLPPLSAPLMSFIANFGMSAFLVVFVLHMACYFRHSKARYPLLAGFVMLIWSATMVIVTMAVQPETSGPLVPTLIASAILSGLYSFLGVGASVAGGFARLNREAIIDRKMTRQELLGRLLEIESLLSKTPQSALVQKRKDNFIDRAQSMQLFPVVAMAIGVLYGIFVVSVVGTYSTLLSSQGGLRITIAQQTVGESGSFILAGLIFFLSFIVYGGVGFLSGSVGRSLLSVALATVGQFIALLVPYGEFGPKYVSEQLAGSSLTRVILYVCVMGVFAGFAGSIHANQDKQRRLSRKDPALLVAEAVQLQWRLNLGSRAACVMSVDVAGSTNLKADADPLRIEYSFREYQEMVAEIAKRHGGHVFSTAGDGAIVAFPNSEMALEAGRDIQGDLASFNQKRNRLDHDFRLRIGLHTGETKAELGDAPFNELIDIAAHIEKVAPVGGIALSGQTAAKLPNATLVELAHAIDGQSVYIVQDPTR